MPTPADRCRADDDSSALHVSENEKPCEEGISLWAAADRFPIGEGPSGQFNLVEGFAASESTRPVVIRLVPGLLKIDEGFGKRLELGLWSLTI